MTAQDRPEGLSGAPQDDVVPGVVDKTRAQRVAQTIEHTCPRWLVVHRPGRREAVKRIAPTPAEAAAGVRAVIRCAGDAELVEAIEEQETILRGPP